MRNELILCGKNSKIARENPDYTLLDKKLVSKNILIKDVPQKGNGVSPKKGTADIIRYGFQKNFDLWEVTPKKGTVPQKGNVVSPKKGTKVSPRLGNTKETLKETIKDNPLTPKGESGNVYFRITDYLNRKTGSNFSFKTKTTQRHINARMKEGFCPDDFKTVIDFKCSQWLTDPEKQEYLRPQTLFNSKFESYLNAAQRKIIPMSSHDDCRPKTDEEIAAFEEAVKPVYDYQRKIVGDEMIDKWLDTRPQ